MKKWAVRIYALVFLALLFAFSGGTVNRMAEGRQAFAWRDDEDGNQTLSDALPGRETLLSLYGWYNAAVGKHCFAESSRLILPNGHIASTMALRDPDPVAQRLSGLYAYCLETGRNFLYVLLPDQPIRDSEMTDFGFATSREENGRLLLSALEARSVPCLNLKEAFTHAPRPYYDYFYRSDHHWTADGGLLAAKLLGEALNERYGLGIDTSVMEEDRYERIVYPHHWVGEQGRITTGRFGAVDDYIVLRPSFDVHLHYADALGGIDREGGFDLLVDRTILERHTMDYSKTSPYYAYLTGHHNLTSIENPDRTGEPILLVKDSMAQVVIPYLSMGTRQIITWDMRDDRGLYGCLEAHPEIRTVVVMYLTSMAFRADMTDFQ